MRRALVLFAALLCGCPPVAPPVLDGGARDDAGAAPAPDGGGSVADGGSLSVDAGAADGGAIDSGR